ncbi:conserved unknown protein [Ectocarpus siliculosus]|uniref:NAD(P)-binding domain-containing protein n=1 Tax=Ectocarpus siliculosus TaxID=2880 RepID=D7FHE2_ECTSI|nr:conserved unknown protein [Ectocarpus siliculosus]|eukprot:CBJ28509.1 conserved unknown protein [Ectocarpus siliculosus]
MSRRDVRVLSAAAAEPYKAVVFGSTGAVGKEVVRALAESEQCQSVVAVVRRLTPVSEWRGDAAKSKTSGSDANFNKVEVKRINYDTLETSLPEQEMRGKQVVFYCLGTTRSDAGSAANFKKVDFSYLEGVCQLCRVAGVDHFSLVSSQGASASSPLLYPKVKGQCEKLVRSAGYPHTSIWRPGLLGRGSKAKGVEKVARFLVTPG